MGGFKRGRPANGRSKEKRYLAPAGHHHIGPIAQGAAVKSKENEEKMLHLQPPKLSKEAMESIFDAAKKLQTHATKLQAPKLSKEAQQRQKAQHGVIPMPHLSNRERKTDKQKENGETVEKIDEEKREKSEKSEKSKSSTSTKSAKKSRKSRNTKQQECKSNSSSDPDVAVVVKGKKKSTEPNNVVKS